MLIGVISDTHGLLRTEAIQALDGVELILHAGDAGSDEILDALGRIAPVVAVRGNNDRTGRAAELPETVTVLAGDTSIYILHDIKQLGSAGKDSHVIVYGHSHEPLVERRGETLYVNPGSAGRKRFSLPVSIAILEITDGVPEARIVQLDV